MDTAIAGSRKPVAIPAVVPTAIADNPERPSSIVIRLTSGPRAVPNRAMIMYSEKLLPTSLPEIYTPMIIGIILTGV